MVPTKHRREFDSWNLPAILGCGTLWARMWATMLFSAPPFVGATAHIVSIISATDFAIQQAVKHLELSSPAATGVEAIKGTIQEQLEVAKVHLTERHASVARKLQAASDGRLPIASLAGLFNTTPRQFLAASRTWVPRAHSGSTEEMEHEDGAILSGNEFILDSVTVLLIATIGAGALLASLPKRPVITRQAADELLDWYLLERDGRRAVGHMNLSDDGRLIITGYTVADRIALLSFWRGVRSIIREHCTIIDSPGTPLAPDAVRLAGVLNNSTLATLHSAKTAGYTLVSEEENVRAVAVHVFGSRAASLHVLLVRSAEQRWIGEEEATRWTAALIGMGWTWVNFPKWMIWTALRLDHPWPVLSAFLSRLPLALPEASINLVFGLLRELDNGSIRGIDAPRLRSALVRSLPKIDAKARKRAVKAYKRSGTSIEHRKSVQSLGRWLRA